MPIPNKLIRKVISVGLCVLIGLVAVGFGHASRADAATLTKADNIINTGKKYLGVKYRFGAPSGVTYAFDCSSFVQYIFKKNGISLPRVSSQQATKGVKIAKTALKRGDLVFFKSPKRTGNSIGHVAVYMGSGKILHTFGSGGVQITSLNTSYWKTNYVTARRVISS